jgi:hypothetical protein
MSFPTNEIAFDTDESIFFTSSGELQSEAQKIALRNLNQHNNLNTVSGKVFYLYFGQPVDIRAAAYLASSTLSNPRCHFSTDSTAPDNGEWRNFLNGDVVTTIGAGSVFERTSFGELQAGEGMREFHASAVGVKALRMRLNSGTFNFLLQTFRVWGIPSDPANALVLWDETLDQEAAADYFDLGNIERGTTKQVSFRIKNVSAVAAVDDVTLSVFDSIGVNAPGTKVQFSDDGSTWGEPLNVGSIAADTISGVVHVRRVVEPDEALNTGAFTIAMNGVWS